MQDIYTFIKAFSLKSASATHVEQGESHFISGCQGCCGNEHFCFGLLPDGRWRYFQDLDVFHSLLLKEGIHTSTYMCSFSLARDQEMQQAHGFMRIIGCYRVLSCCSTVYNQVLSQRCGTTGKDGATLIPS